MTGMRDYLEIIQLLAPSLLTAAAVAMGGSLIGVFVLLRREGMVGVAIPQVVAIGAALGLRLSWPTLPLALVCVFVAVILLTLRNLETSNRLLPCLYVGGLSLSFLLVANSGAHVAEMQNLFTGVDVTVTDYQAAIAIPSLVMAGLLTALLWRRWLLVAQMPSVAELADLHPRRWNALFLMLLSVILVIGTNALGVLMVLAMLFLPAATALPWTRRVPTALLASTILSVFFLAAGFVLSVEKSWPMSQSVGGVGFSCLIASHLLHYWR